MGPDLSRVPQGGTRPGCADACGQGGSAREATFPSCSRSVVKCPQALDTLVDQSSRGAESGTDTSVPVATCRPGVERHSWRSGAGPRRHRKARSHRVRRAEGLRYQQHRSFNGEQPQAEETSDKRRAHDGATRQRSSGRPGRLSRAAAGRSQPDSCRCRPPARKAWLVDA
jgi:hypothetical protein